MQDNLNTHRPAPLYQAFDPAEARRIADRFEGHHTPKHGSWRNIAECDPSTLDRQHLTRRIPDHGKLEEQTRAWETPRNKGKTAVEWRFSTDDARMKLATSIRR